MNRQYPCLEISRSRLRHNMEEVISRCTARGIQVCGVIKGCSGLPEVGRLFRDCGATQLASSRLEQIIRCRQVGVPGPYMLLRIPMESELEDVARWCDYSLESERATLDALEEACARQGAVHKAVIMADLGDLREGFWDQDEMLDVCVHVERDLPHVELAGVGVNLGCYGSIQPTPENLGQLVHIARRVEAAIGRKLEIVSGGATSSFTLVHWGTMPEGINHLRIGETALLAKDLQEDWGISDMDYLQRGTMYLEGELIELRKKPTYPVGETMIDAFGRRPTYEDRGVRLRGLVAFGRADVGDLESLLCREEGMTIIGGSSDHCIVDAEDCPRPLQVGDTVAFDLCYSHMLYATGRSDMAISIVDTE